VVEALTGGTYEFALTEQVLKPLGLKRSFIFPTHVMTHRFAVGHATTEQNEIVLTPWEIMRSGHPAGGIASTVTDQLRYARFQMGDDSITDSATVISSEARRVMQREVVAAELDNKMGLSWFLADTAGLRFVAHGGGTLGQISTFVMVPERNFAVTVLTNSFTGGLMTREIHKLAYNQFLGITLPEPQPSETALDSLSEYAGHYRGGLADIDLKVEQGNLMKKTTWKGGFPKRDSPPGPAQPPSRLAFTAHDRVLALDPPSEGAQAEFLRNEAGTIEWLRGGGRLYRRS
jgi:CubicO group peptidase (beta-lactamase class C family)